MLKTISAFLLLIILMGNLSAVQNKEIMLRDLDIIKSTFEAKYAPYEWKKTYFGWSLEEEINIAKFKILSLNSLSVKDYQKILHSFFISMCDYHVGASYFATEAAVLPFQINSVREKYLISDASPQIIEIMQKNGLYIGETLNIGDEIIMFDSQPIANVIEDLKFNAVGNPTSKTSQVIAELTLTQRHGSRGLAVPQGPIQLVVKNAQGIESTIHAEWLYVPELIKDRSYRTAMATFGKVETKAVKHDAFQSVSSHPFSGEPKIMMNQLAQFLQQDKTDLYEEILSKTIADYQKNDSYLKEEGASEKPKTVKRSDIEFGKKLWEDPVKTNYKAYIFKHRNSQKRIGYIRIDTYFPSIDPNQVNVMAVHLAKILSYFENNTDALLIDQVDNPGGYLLYTMAIASMLTDKPLKMPIEQEILTQESIAQAFQEISEANLLLAQPESTANPKVNLIAGYPLDKRFILSQSDHAKFIISQWEAGKHLTAAAPVHGIEHLAPHPLASYTKPIVVLVNSNNFSCADLFPAILQDNKRALIFGERTAGAGGSVKKHTYPNSLGIQQFTYTTTLATRPDGSPIENLGVMPDIPYKLTINDVLNGYGRYIKTVNDAFDKLLQP